MYRYPSSTPPGFTLTSLVTFVYRLSNKYCCRLFVGSGAGRKVTRTFLGDRAIGDRSVRDSKSGSRSGRSALCWKRGLGIWQSRYPRAFKRYCRLSVAFNRSADIYYRKQNCNDGRWDNKYEKACVRNQTEGRALSKKTAAILTSTKKGGAKEC